ncbi:hypothetical protein F4778DRAFT_726464 [Xylariomycetidae sp. FL2044]|nr:hypothetical protein F4778DRAFT_726464 [Xylariomycetidae sp. FL2044]
MSMNRNIRRRRRREGEKKSRAIDSIFIDVSRVVASMGGGGERGGDQSNPRPLDYLRRTTYLQYLLSILAPCAFTPGAGTLALLYHSVSWSGQVRPGQARSGQVRFYLLFFFFLPRYVEA